MILTYPHPIFRNFWLKTFSVALATVIWLAIHYGIRNELSISQLNINRINVPVSVLTMPDDPRVFKLTPSEITVFAVGDVKTLRREVHASIDLSNFRARQSLAEDVHIEAPQDINVLQVNPLTVGVEQLTK